MESSSPLREAAHLIQSLDMARTKMIGSAADAATEAETARRNARTAQEIARRYQNRSYPAFGFDSDSAAPESVSSTGASSAAAAAAASVASSSFGILSRPKHPGFKGYNHNKNKNNHNNNSSRNGNDKEKKLEHKDDSPTDKNAGDNNNNNDNNNNDTARTRTRTRSQRAPHTPTSASSSTSIYASPSPKAKDSETRSITGANSNSNARPAAVVRTRGDFLSPTSVERIARHHADDLLQLTMELERNKQELKSEQRLRKQFQSSLSSLKSKAAKAESLHQKLNSELQTERTQSTAEISDLKKDLKVSGMKLQAAEEDAQLALDLARDSAEEKDRMEELLRKTQKEVDNLRLRIKHQGGSHRETLTSASPSPLALASPTRRVHFADNDNPATDATIPTEPKSLTATGVQKQKEDKALPVSDSSTSTRTSTNTSTSTSAPREGGPSRAMIAAGRQLLLRRNMSPQDAVIRLELTPSKSAERRQLLSERLNKSLNDSANDDTNANANTNTALLSSSPARTLFSSTPGVHNASGEHYSNSNSITNTDIKNTLEEYHAAIKTLETSGKRLDLDGYFWREHAHSKTHNKPSHNPIRIDQMTRQYCQNVEFKIDRQLKDINQLESLLGYLEKKLVLDE